MAAEDLLPDLERRKGGIQKGTTPRQEEDYPIFMSGVFNGKTTGFPVTILFENKNIRSEDYNKQRSIPRPGHADWVANQKFGGNEDYRGGGHFSARLTTGIVAAGVIAKKLMKDVSIQADVTEIGGEKDLEKGLQKHSLQRSVSVPLFFAATLPVNLQLYPVLYRFSHYRMQR